MLAKLAWLIPIGLLVSTYYVPTTKADDVCIPGVTMPLDLDILADVWLVLGADDPIGADDGSDGCGSITGGDGPEGAEYKYLSCYRWSASPQTCADSDCVCQYGKWGMYYCPPSGHPACDANGSPTSGTNHLRLTVNGEKSASWDYYLDGGVPTNGGAKKRVDTDANKVEVAFEGSGTFGGHAYLAPAP